MIPAGPLFHKPASVIAARNILYAVLFLSIVTFLLVQFALNLPGYPNRQVTVLFISLIILLYIAIRYIGFGKKWARILFVFLFVVNSFAFAMYATVILKENLALGFLFGLQILLQIPALVYLFRKSSTDWFNSFDSVEAAKTKVVSK